jgi:hypothetical protein
MKMRRIWVELETPTTREKRHGAAALQDAGARSGQEKLAGRFPETVKTGKVASVLATTSLKRGVNEN